MQLLRCIIPGFILVAPLFGMVGHWTPVQRPSLSAPFLEEWGNFGQGTFSKDALTFSQDSLTIGRLITLGADPKIWSQAQIDDLSRVILLKSHQYKVSPLFVLSLIHVESSFRPDAVSPVGAIGLMQLMPETAEEMIVNLGSEWKGVETLEDPRLNIDLGLRYVTHLKGRFRDPRLVLTAYNRGPEAVRRILRAQKKIPLEYYEKVMQAMDHYQGKASHTRPVSRAWSTLWL